MPLQIIDTGYGLERFCWACRYSNYLRINLPESVAWLKEQAGFSQKYLMYSIGFRLASRRDESSVWYYEHPVGSDGDRMREVFLTRLGERGHSIDSEMFAAITEPLSKIYAIPVTPCKYARRWSCSFQCQGWALARMIARRV